MGFWKQERWRKKETKWQLKQKQKETAAQLNAIMENINGGVSAVTLDETGVPFFHFANDQYYEMLGFTRERFQAEVECAFDLIHPEDRERVVNQTRQASQTGNSFSCIYRVVRADGSLMWVKSNISITEISGIKKPVQIAVANDITAQIKSEQKEFEASEQMRAIMQNVNGGVSVATLNDKKIGYVYVNDAYYEMFGYTREQFTQELPQGLVDIIYPEDVDMVVSSAETSEKTGKPARIEFRAKKRDGSIIWVRSNSSSCCITGIEEPVHIAVLNDVTKEKREEEEARQRELEIRLHYEREQQLRHELIRDSIIYYQLNLTTGMIEEYQSRLSDAMSFQTPVAVSEEIRTTVLGAILPEDKELVANTVLSAALSEAYKRGETHVRVEYRRYLDNNELCWVRNVATIMKRPKTEEVIAFLYIRNVDLQKKKQLALDSIIDEEIEEVCVINVKTGKAFFAKANDLQVSTGGIYEFIYDDRILSKIRLEVIPEDWQNAGINL